MSQADQKNTGQPWKTDKMKMGPWHPSGIRYFSFQLYRQSMGQGIADMDFAAVKKVFERISDA
jgi:hypothetical protein